MQASTKAAAEPIFPTRPEAWSGGGIVVPGQRSVVPPEAV